MSTEEAKRVTDTGSHRDSREDKGRFDLIPVEWIVDMAFHLEKGAKKYGDNNWQKGQPISWYRDSAMRHLFKAFAGMVDEDHFTAAAWNLLAAKWTLQKIHDGQLPSYLDDIPRTELSYMEHKYGPDLGEPAF